MQAPMVRDKSPLKYHFKNDGRWTAEGHKLAAEELAIKIRSIWY